MTDYLTLETEGDHGPVLVGRGLITKLDEILPELLGDKVEQLLIVHQPTLGAISEDVRALLAPKYRRVLMAEVPDAESAKRVQVAEFLWQIMGQSDFTRSDAILAIGGGAVTDLAGWTAASWLRGVKVVHVPTTVLAMVDASIGGKTGVNTNEGKNLVGAFYPPAGVVVDLDSLAALPRNELVTGFTEALKVGFIHDHEILDLIEADPQKATDPNSEEFRRILEIAIRYKLQVTSDDLTEQGGREMLNYGHTLGHAIEHSERYQWRHGAAVAVGMRFVAELARLSGRLTDEEADRHTRILELLGLPTQYPAGRWPTLLSTMKRDKKARGAMLRFVVLDAIGKPAIMQAPDESLLFAAYQEIAS
ncbi:3-dehydroquinate synthase [Gulosibacter chungangensis]|uniref:3-dehydroquinate synthase n=1 Tax=Gulosibacter chungangensis TaxID=979746 RepID=A0A7J5BD40_9MICO|nr:3-dehydroquinate synthase [Gulosibacter chungangensis]KAB1644069.1 3-dehydroquinate synthase [Gulosibacter chungangensis]